jgi:ADP-ribose pyrophosphatase
LRIECRGRRVRFTAELTKLPNGKSIIVDRVEFPNSVAILPIINEKHVVLLKQYRPSLNKWIFEVPAGVIDPGEKPEEAARRELREEAGLIAGELIKIGEGYVSPGYSTEYMYLFIALNPGKARQSLEDHEVIELAEFTLNDAVNMVEEGKITDVKTITLLFAATSILHRKS